MKYLPAAVIAASLAGTAVSAPANANTKNLAAVQKTAGKKAAVVKQVKASGDLQKELKKMGISLSSCPSLSYLSGGDSSCPIQSVLDKLCNNNQSGSGQTNPNKPGTVLPGKPDTEKPGDSQKPDNNKPDQGGTENGGQDAETDSSFAGQVAKLVNEERAKAGLPAVTVNKKLQSAAQVRAKEIETSFSHTRPNGSSFSTVLSENGITYRGSGENIAWGQTSPEQVMNGWMNSSGHRANILNKNFTSIGVGYYKSNTGKTYWTQLFTY